MGFLKRWAGNKKAQDITTTLFYLLFGLILAGFFVVAVMMRVKDAVNDSTYHKRFYARDLALLVDAMHASNGAFMIKYEIITPEEMNLEAFVESGRVFITDASDKPAEQKAQTSFLFGSSNDTGVKKSSVSSSIHEFRVVMEADRNISFTDQAIILMLPATPKTVIVPLTIPSSATTGGSSETAWSAGSGGDPANNKKILNKVMDEMSYNDPSQRAGLAAIIQGESSFRAITENMNYNGARLMQVFPSRFQSLEQAEALAQQGPEAIANYLYGTGSLAAQLGNTESGDGWKYRGRGFIQLTGRANYAKYSEVAGVDLVANPEALTDPMIAARVAVGYMKDRTRGSSFDDQLMAVGGSTIGWDKKREYYQAYLQSGEFATGSTYYG